MKKKILIIENDIRKRRVFVEAISKSGEYDIKFDAFGCNTISKPEWIGVDIIFINLNSLSPIFSRGILEEKLEEIMEKFPALEERKEIFTEILVFISPDGYRYSKLKTQNEPFEAFISFTPQDVLSSI